MTTRTRRDSGNQNRTDPEGHKQKVRAANQARRRATERLIDKHGAEFDMLYAEEAAEVGVTPSGRRLTGAARTKALVARLRQQIAELEAESG